MNEAKYQEIVRQSFRNFGILTTFHNDALVRYIPDLSFSGRGVDGWVEIKYCAKPPRMLSSIKHLTAGQIDWLCLQGEAGAGNCYLMVGAPGENYMIRWHALRKAMTTPWGLLCKLDGVLYANSPYALVKLWLA